MSRYWKQSEKRHAERFDGERTSRPYANIQDSVGWDGQLIIESKNRKTLPMWLKDAMAQAESYASEGQLPVVILHEKFKHTDNDIVLVRLKHFEVWFGPLSEERVPE